MTQDQIDRIQGTGIYAPVVHYSGGYDEEPARRYSPATKEDTNPSGTGSGFSHVVLNAYKNTQNTLGPGIAQNIANAIGKASSSGKTTAVKPLTSKQKALAQKKTDKLLGI